MGHKNNRKPILRPRQAFRPEGIIKDLSGCSAVKEVYDWPPFQNEREDDSNTGVTYYLGKFVLRSTVAVRTLANEFPDACMLTYRDRVVLPVPNRTTYSSSQTGDVENLRNSILSECPSMKARVTVDVLRSVIQDGTQPTLALELDGSSHILDDISGVENKLQKSKRAREAQDHGPSLYIAIGTFPTNEEAKRAQELWDSFEIIGQREVDGLYVCEQPAIPSV